MDTRSWFRKVLFLSLGAVGFSAQLSMAATDTATLTIGAVGSGGCSSITTGYSSFVPAGGYTPTTLTGGMTVALLVDINEFFPGCPNYAVLGVKGFESNPGAGWLTSVTCNGVTNPVSTAQFQYIASQNNEGQWTWTTPSGAIFGFLSHGGGAQVSCTIVHN